VKKVWSDEAWEEYLYWQTQDKKIIRKINNLIKNIDRKILRIYVKPEQLSGNLAGYWSVRIDKANRIVFKIVNNTLEIWQCGSHYRDK